jgi:hypothetical protein
MIASTFSVSFATSYTSGPKIGRCMSLILSERISQASFSTEIVKTDSSVASDGR